MMTYKEAEDAVYASYLRADRFHDYSDPDSLRRDPRPTAPLLRRLSSVPAVVVTGSKGKGSVAAMTAAILGRKMRVGLMTSPHIACFRERFRVDGSMISEEEFVESIEALKPEFDAIDASLAPNRCVSPIAVQAAVGLRWFASKSTAFNVLECGKGARFDDVNNAVHRYAVINTIFLEHTRELGSTVGEIAADKASVITDDTRLAFVAGQSDEAMELIETRAAAAGAELRRYGMDFAAENVEYTRQGMIFDVVVGSRRFERLRLPLLGVHQTRNAALALALALEVEPTLSYDDVAGALASVSWPGRMEVVAVDPPVVVDACVNRQSAMQVADTLAATGLDRYTLVMAIPVDKDYRGVALALAAGAVGVIMTTTSNPHYRFSPTQADDVARMSGRRDVIWMPTVAEAVAAARATALPVVIVGTTSMLTDLEALCGQ